MKDINEERKVDSEVMAAALDQVNAIQKMHQKYLHEDDGKLSALKGKVIKSAVNCGSEIRITFEDGQSLSFYALNGEVPFILK